uniref:TRUD domain-containing protein n=1 Tax=Parastrongyloides trichosuri TaxID=131310 RepID=A0A0N4Z661_PARTI
MDVAIEQDVTGIRCYANPENWTSISCQFKMMFSDFIVEELDSNGVVTLWPLNGVEEILIHDVKNGKLDGNEKIVISGIENEKELETKELELPKGLTAEHIASIGKLEKGDTVVIDVNGLEKTERGEIHKYFKSSSQKLSTKTSEDTIIVSIANNNDRKRRHWPDDVPNYCHFTLSKENKDTSYAIREIATKCGLNMKLFSFSGNKDRRGITSQRVSAFRVQIEKLKKISECIKSIRLHNFEYRDNQLGLGDNIGNRFQIILRDVGNEITLDDIKKRCEGTNKYGFLNYFGHQRFGTLGISTAEIGRLILRKDFQTAIDKILSSKKEMSRETFQEALLSYGEDRDAKKAFGLIKGNGKKYSIEGTLLKALINKNANPQSALLSLPRETISLYIHAFQSYLFNEVISQRIEKYGPVILKGDIGEDGKPLTDDASIFDICIPLVSTEMDFPENETKEMIEKLMEKYEIKAENFTVLSKHLMVSKVLRRMFKKPKDLIDCDIIKYSNEKSIIQRELINGPDEVVEDTKYVAIKLTFSLDAGDYATMLLREILRFNVDKESQKNMIKSI